MTSDTTKYLNLTAIHTVWYRDTRRYPIRNHRWRMPMQRPYADLLKRIDTLSPAELVAIDERARELGVGGSRWEEAWLAARQGHTSAITAYSRSVSAGATPVAAAAIAGAVAAQHTDALITQNQYETLVQPVADAIAPGRRAVVAVAWIAAA